MSVCSSNKKTDLPKHIKDKVSDTFGCLKGRNQKKTTAMSVTEGVKCCHPMRPLTYVIPGSPLTYRPPCSYIFVCVCVQTDKAHVERCTDPPPPPPCNATPSPPFPIARLQRHRCLLRSVNSVMSFVAVRSSRHVIWRVFVSRTK